MREATKTLQLLTAAELNALSGKGLDIGCGDDPIRPNVERFDVEHGDANCITQFVRELESYDYVFSSHCLEHMRDPRSAIAEWWKLLKPNGTMFVIVPDEDLYEQGYWPSLFNNDHKATFTISKERSWSPVSYNLRDLAGALPNAEIVSLRLQDDRYRRAYLARRWPYAIANLAVRAHRFVQRSAPRLGQIADRLYVLLRLPVDQTTGNAVAQDVLVVTKRNGSTHRI